MEHTHIIKCYMQIFSIYGTYTIKYKRTLYEQCLKSSHSSTLGCYKDKSLMKKMKYICILKVKRRKKPLFFRHLTGLFFFPLVQILLYRRDDHCLHTHAEHVHVEYYTV